MSEVYYSIPAVKPQDEILTKKGGRREKHLERFEGWLGKAETLALPPAARRALTHKSGSAKMKAESRMWPKGIVYLRGGT